MSLSASISNEEDTDTCNKTYVLADLVPFDDLLDVFSVFVETERKRSPLNMFGSCSCAEAVARAAAKISAKVFILRSR